MAKIHTIEILSEQEIRDIHQASLAILGETGVRVHHEGILSRLEEAGAEVNRSSGNARFPESLVMDSVARAGKQYVLYGRDERFQARFGYGELSLMSSPGQFSWIDETTHQRRLATMQDTRKAIRLGDALENITVVGAMAQPSEVPETIRDVVLTAELAKGTRKPTRCWVRNGRSAEYVLEIYKTLAGGSEALRAKPRVEAFLEPISPLQLPGDGLDIVTAFAEAGQPVSIGPMAMCSGTAPATLAGTLVQENAEILAGVVVTQCLVPGTAILYGGIPHILDPRTSLCSFGSPEQGVLALGMVAMAHFYGFPVYINVGLTDAKVPDAQSGIEKSSTLLMGALAGADTFGHCGICGADHAGSLLWLQYDHELMNYVKRILRGFRVHSDTLATEVIQQTGPAGDYLSHPHTVQHYRNEMWLPSKNWTRQTWDEWKQKGESSFGERLNESVHERLETHTVEPLEEDLFNEIDNIVAYATKELT